ncbi:hypothetical protein ABE504_01490 [Paenibacillus oryzisoli]|uniref:hypothetical protein n=1 Tax=Paenibacillus oryzisoli TaxID=1850517 RepID=UPI003D26F8CE
MKLNWKNRIKRLVPYIILCGLIFTVLTTINKFYAPSKIVLETNSSVGTEGTFAWDSGKGFNDQETISFVPYTPEDFDAGITHTIRIQRLDDVNSNSKGSEVFISNIEFDGKKQTIQEFLFPNISKLNENGMLAIEKSSTLEINKKFKTFSINLENHQWAGKVKITVDQSYSRTIDLYSGKTFVKKVDIYPGAKQEPKKIEFNVPQIKISQFKLMFSQDTEILSLSSQVGNQTQKIQFENSLGKREYKFSKTFDTQTFSITLVLVQLAISFIITHFVYLAIDGWRRDGNHVRKIFTKTYLPFWIFWIINMGTFSIWLLGQWPGIMSVDSYHFTWREIKTLQFSDVTPWIYNVYVLILTQFFDSPAVVSVFQIILLTSISSLAFFWFYEKGSKTITLICYILFITSVPVGLYSITMWKDIPFNIIMLFWGLFLFYLYICKHYKNKVVILRFSYIFYLSLTIFLLCTIRHNGIIFIVIIPALLSFFKLMNRKNIVQLVTSLILIFGVFYIITPSVTNTNREAVSDFFSKTYRVGPLAALHLSPNFNSIDKEKDMRLLNKWVSKEELSSIYRPTSQADSVGVLVSKWQALPEPERSELNRLYFIGSITNLNVFLADRISMLFGTMGFADNVFFTTNELKGAGSDQSTWRPIEAYRFKLSTVNERLQTFIEKFIYNRLYGFTVFNTLPSMLLLIMLIVLYKYIPAASLYAFVFIINIPFLFIVLSTAEWRYLYFLLLASYFALPIAALECKLRKKKIKELFN